ncbi:MAG: nickel pincer cofactor biosynthesis protein LarC [Promethearchaeota archaeon]
MRTLYIDMNNSGISGDMFLSSLLGLIPESEALLIKLEDLKNYLPGVIKLKIDLVNTERSGIQLNQLKIEIKENKEHRNAKILKRSLNNFLEGIEISNNASLYAKNVLNTLIQAESKVHGKLTENIHLHELSSVDTLIDISGVAITLDKIKAFEKDFQIFCSKIPLGGGTVDTKHGTLAIPAPATIKILQNSNLITFGGPIDSELVTPTGAALISNLDPIVLQYPNEMRIIKSIYSTGQKEFKNFLNILRIFYGKIEVSHMKEFYHPLQKFIKEVAILETDVDDVSGEILGNFISKLEKENILDVQIIPTQTKKNRPGYIIKILCLPDQIFKIIEKIIYELGTLGVRFQVINRVCIKRKFEKKNIEVDKNLFNLGYKISFIESDNKIEIVNIKPEFDDLKKISEETGLPLKKIQFIAQAKVKQIYEEFFK